MATPVTAPLAPFASPAAVSAPPDATPRPKNGVLPAWRPLDGLGTALTALLAIDAAVAVLCVVAFVQRLLVLEDIVDSGDLTFALRERARSADDFVDSSRLVFVLLLLATGIVFIVWNLRAANNNDALGRDRPRLSPGWAIGGWFIPLANLVLPVLLIQDLWRGSDATTPRGDMRWRIADRSLLVGWWWGLFLASWLRFGSSDGLTDPGDDADGRRFSDLLGMMGSLCAIAAAVLAILVVRGLAARQAATLAAQQAAWTATHEKAGA